MVSASHLHAPLAKWFSGRFASLSRIQRAALPHTLAGENTLILAPTGSGKTLAAFLSILSELGREAEAQGLPNAVRAVYVSPLKALDADIRRNLEQPLATLNDALPAARRIRMEVRTGDTDLPERGRQQRRHPHLLLTTPESVASLLSQKGWKDGFQTRAVVVDEIHAVAENKRGSLLSLTLERLEAQSGTLQRIGLSATAWPVETVARFLCGERPCAVAASDLRRVHRLEIDAPENACLPPAGHNPYRAAHVAARLVDEARCTLVFTDTRSAAERLGLALQILLPEHEDRIAVHHASVDRARRLEIEAGLAAGALKACVCSTSLEMGLDFDAVDQVLLIGAPRGVSRALQRLGRSGHRVEGVAEGSLVPTSLPDLLECAALRAAAHAGRLDPLRPPQTPLDVLAQALLGMSVERRWGCDEAFERVRRAGPYLGLARTDFDATLEYLAGGGPALAAYPRYGKILLHDGGFEAASPKVAREYYLNIGTISEDLMVKVIGRGNRRLGQVEEDFLETLQPGEAFTIGGKAVRLRALHQDAALVDPARGERVRTPRWLGGSMQLSTGLAAEELQLRRDLREAWDTGGAAACRRTLEKGWGLRKPAAAVLAAYLARQNAAMPIPADSPVVVERFPAGRSAVTLFHVLAGRGANHAMAWVAARRLGGPSSVMANFDDHGFFLTFDSRRAPAAADLRAAFAPRDWKEDLRAVVESTETLGRQFRSVAETGQLLPRRTTRGRVSRRSASWSGSLLYNTLQRYQPDHPLVREAVREALEDKLDMDQAEREAARIYAAEWEVHELPFPSPFALPLWAAFNPEPLLKQDREKAFEELAASLYEEWA